MDFYWTCKLEIKHEALSVQFNETTYWLLNGLFFHLPRRCAVHPLDSDLPSFTAVVLTFTLSYIIYLADKRQKKRWQEAGTHSISQTPAIHVPAQPVQFSNDE